MSELKAAVSKLLIVEHDLTDDDATELIENSNPDIWHAEADPKELANYLASGEDDE